MLTGIWELNARSVGALNTVEGKMIPAKGVLAYIGKLLFYVTCVPCTPRVWA